jgi:hypothetical protein
VGRRYDWVGCLGIIGVLALCWAAIIGIAILVANVVT